MPCIRVEEPNFVAIICHNTHARLHMMGRYIWMSFHDYSGPSFFWDYAMTKEYDVINEDDPIWEVFEVWLKKHEAKQERQRKKWAKKT